MIKVDQYHSRRTKAHVGYSKINDIFEKVSRDYKTKGFGARRSREALKFICAILSTILLEGTM